MVAGGDVRLLELQRLEHRGIREAQEAVVSRGPVVAVRLEDE